MSHGDLGGVRLTTAQHAEGDVKPWPMSVLSRGVIAKTEGALQAATIIMIYGFIPMKGGATISQSEQGYTSYSSLPLV